MSKLLYFYESDVNLRRNIPVYLSKEGLELYHISNIYEVDRALEEFQPKAILVHTDSDAILLSRTSVLPIVVVTDNPINTYDDNKAFKDIKNPVFIRSCNDSLDTILNTAKLATTL